MTENDIPETEQSRRFTEIHFIETADAWLQYVTCLECGAFIVIDENDRKADIHPMAIHLKWHDDENAKINKIKEVVDELITMLSGGIPKSMAEELPKAPTLVTDEPK